MTGAELKLPPSMRRRVFKYVLLTSYVIVIFATGAFVALAGAAILYINSKPELSIWHRADLQNEFTVRSGISDLTGYLQLEEKLFAELKSDVYDQIPPELKSSYNRFTQGSQSDPGIWPVNWNRTFIRGDADAPFGVLLLHGYSDSPYSLQGFATLMQQANAYVVGLRIPGHGTIPAALKYTKAEDMTAAVRLAMQHLKIMMGNRPIFIIGYSNGGALAVNYALEAVEDASLVMPSGLVLMSPEIGISRAAAYASWQAWIGDKLGLDKLAWSSVLPEFDPYKYNSFAVNAGDQAYRMTQKVRTRLERIARDGKLGLIPPIMAFQSAADSTVLADALVTELFDRLGDGPHELVIFDVNRYYEAQGLISKPIDLEAITSGPARPYDVTLVTNRDSSGFDAVLNARAAGELDSTTIELGLSWPDEIYSLSHIALPFSPADPLYGDDPAARNPGIRLGRLAMHGENNTLSIPPTMMTRQRWNPFHPYLEQRTMDFVKEHLTASQ